jgi:hypothetical protein
MNSITGRFNRPEVKIARILIVVIFLALIRTIAEMFRLQDEQSHLIYQQVRMCVSGALTAAIGLFILVLLSFWSKHLITILLGVITLLLLFVIKGVLS